MRLDGWKWKSFLPNAIFVPPRARGWYQYGPLGSWCFNVSDFSLNTQQSPQLCVLVPSTHCTVLRFNSQLNPITRITREIAKPLVHLETTGIKALYLQRKVSRASKALSTTEKLYMDISKSSTAINQVVQHSRKISCPWKNGCAGPIGCFSVEKSDVQILHLLGTVMHTALLILWSHEE